MLQRLPSYGSREPLLRTVSWISAIAVIALSIATSWAWSVSWIGNRITAARFADAMEQTNGKAYPGFRRAHSKGAAMNSFPFFPVSTSQGFYEQRFAAQPDPATGKPDPKKLAAFFTAHPEALRYEAWAKTASRPSSWANTELNGVDAFRFVTADGTHRYVRWSVRPQARLIATSAQQRAQATGDYMREEFQHRLTQGPVRWGLVVTLAQPRDAIDDPSRPWPRDRTQVIAGTLELDQLTPQATGACRAAVMTRSCFRTGLNPRTTRFWLHVQRYMRNPITAGKARSLAVKRPTQLDRKFT